MSSKQYSNSITLVRVADGSSASSYFVETNYDEVLRFVHDNDISFSPSFLKFGVIDFSKTGDQYLKNFKWKIYALVNNEYEKLCSSEEADLSDIFTYHEKALIVDENTPAPVSEDEDYTHLYFYLDDYLTILRNKPDSEKASYEKAFLDSVDAAKESQVLKFVYFEEGIPRVEKVLVIKNGVSADMAQLNIKADGIVASMREASLEFSAEGLKLQNGDFSIWDTTYDKLELLVLTSDIVPQQDKKYYFLNSEGNYAEAVIENNQFNPVIEYYEEVDTKETVRYYRDGQSYLPWTEEFDPNQTYYEKRDYQAFGIDTTTKKLTFEGDVYANNGYFKGEIDAVKGSFAGTISAQSGEIGGFIISKDEETGEIGIVSSDGNLKLLSNDGQVQGQSKIIVTNIEIGSGAQIADRIVFPYGSDDSETSAYIYNPKNHGNLWLSTENINLYADGRLELGKIEMFGGGKDSEGKYQGSFIGTSEYDANGQKTIGEWRINEDGTAYFKNLIADEVRIQNSVLEIGTVQSIGSLMLFKDAWNVESVNGNEITLDKAHNLKVGDYVYSDGLVFKVEGLPIIEEIDEEDIKEQKKKKLILNSSTNLGKVVTKFGNTNKDYILSVYGESDYDNTRYKFATPNSLTIAGFKEKDNDLDYTKHLILGDLSNSNLTALKGKGFGLYADNVFLTGSLTTQYRESNKENNDEGLRYAGINTKSPVAFNKKSQIVDNSSIVIWAGAKGQDEDAIQKSPFQVTSNGTMYSSNAIIEESMVVGSKLYGSEIYTAEIHGWNEEGAGQLSIYDSANGIVFYNTDVETNKTSEQFRIYSNGMAKNDKNFIDLTGTEAIFTGGFKSSTGEIEIDANDIIFSGFTSGKRKTGVISGSVDDDVMKLQIDVESSRIVVQKESIVNDVPKVKITHNLDMGEGKMVYQQVNDGYDLYVY